MKIFIPSPPGEWRYSRFVANLFQEAGCNVLYWNCAKRTPLTLLTHLPGQLSRFGTFVNSAERSLAFLRAVREFKPDVIYIEKALMIHSKAVSEAIRSTGARLIIWYPDNPFWADQTNMSLLRNLRRCDIFYSWGKFLIPVLLSSGCESVRYLPFGFYPEYFPNSVNLNTEDHNKYDCDIVFIGAWDPSREKDLLPLAKHDLQIWGPNWRKKTSRTSPLFPRIQGEGLYGVEMVKAYRCAKLVFNHLRTHNGNSHNIRTMEIPGIGGAEVVRWTEEQAINLFRDNEHIFCYKGGSNSMAERVSELLSLSSKSIQNVRARGKHHVFANHLLKYRVQQILSDVGYY